MKMNPEIKARWVEALRSGKYQQGAHRLRNQYDLFCCLGVLCDLHSKETGTQWEQPVKESLCYVYQHQNGSLPDDVKAWAKIRTEEQHTLILMNDSYSLAFKNIADYIEESL